MDPSDYDDSSPRPDRRSYARTRTRSGSSSYSYPFEEGARATKAEVSERVRDIPATGDWIGDGSSLDQLAAIYSRVTGRAVDRVTTPQRKFLAACYRTHGDNLKPILAKLYASGGETNLLLRVREHPPVLTIVPEPKPAAPSRPATGAGTGDWDLDDVPEGIIDPADRSHRQDNISCRDYHGHQLRHRYVGGERWMCEACAEAMAS